MKRVRTAPEMARAPSVLDVCAAARVGILGLATNLRELLDDRPNMDEGCLDLQRIERRLR